MVAFGAGTKIFISYRRSGEIGFVGRLADRLSSIYGEENVFRDISGLRFGESFEKRIGLKLSEATLVIAVIGADWVGKRLLRKSRIRMESDWVRKELEHSVASETPVIPVLVGDAVLPTINQLPTSLKGLLAVHTARIRDESWENDFSELRNAIDAVVQNKSGGSEEESFVWRRIGQNTPSNSRFLHAIMVILLIVIAIASAIFLAQPHKEQVPGAIQSETVRLDDSSTWSAPKPSEARSPVASLALQLALLELQASTKEASGDNAGYNVSKFTQRFGMQKIPWSSAFVTWCYLEAVRRQKNNGDATLPFVDSPSTQIVAASLKRNGWLREPFNAEEARPGDIVFFRRFGQSIGHSEIIYSTNSEVLCSIGGNVNNQVTGSCRPINSEIFVALSTIAPEAFAAP